MWARLPGHDGARAGRWHAVRLVEARGLFSGRYASACRRHPWWMTPGYAEESADPPAPDRCAVCVRLLVARPAGGGGEG